MKVSGGQRNTIGCNWIFYDHLSDTLNKGVWKSKLIKL